ncbi:MAG TPA: hypothetical protein DCX07_07545, partial [Phycisphaerales bacterium]|nr:hypothetical protein [Phycisphaerales bacterium]
RPLHGFTLIELLVVIAIISLLVGILTPSLQRAKDIARDVYCSINLRQISVAMNFYADDAGDWFPPPRFEPMATVYGSWWFHHAKMDPYLPGNGITVGQHGSQYGGSVRRQLIMCPRWNGTNWSGEDYPQTGHWAYPLNLLSPDPKNDPMNKGPDETLAIIRRADFHTPGTTFVIFDGRTTPPAIGGPTPYVPNVCRQWDWSVSQTRSVYIFRYWNCEPADGGVYAGPTPFRHAGDTTMNVAHVDSSAAALTLDQVTRETLQPRGRP